MSKGKVDPKVLAFGNSFKSSKRPEIIVGSRAKEEFPGLAEALNELDYDGSVHWEVPDEYVTPLKLKLQRWLRGKNLNESFGVVTQDNDVWVVRK